MRGVQLKILTDPCKFNNEVVSLPSKLHLVLENFLRSCEGLCVTPNFSNILRYRTVPPVVTVTNCSTPDEDENKKLGQG